MAVNVSIAERRPWLGLSGSSFVTPFAVTLGFEASNLRPGIYTANLILTSPSPLVLEPPVRVPVTFVVGDGLLVRPTSLAFIDTNCAAGAAQNQTLRVEASDGVTFTVALLNALHAYKREFVSSRQLAEEACAIEIDCLGEPIGKPGGTNTMIIIKVGEHRSHQ